MRLTTSKAQPSPLPLSRYRALRPYPLSPLPTGERNFVLSGGSLKVFWSNGLVGSIVTLAL